MSNLDALPAEIERLNILRDAMRRLGVRRYRAPDGLEIELAPLAPATAAPITPTTSHT
jgi:hypothetical protein